MSETLSGGLSRIELYVRTHRVRLEAMAEDAGRENNVSRLRRRVAKRQTRALFSMMAAGAVISKL